MALRPLASIELQHRDFALLRTLFESRIMTSAHAALLHFEGRREAAKKRLQKLKAAGLIGERKRRAYEPAVLFLTLKGLLLLEERGILAEYPRLGLLSLEKRTRVSNLTLEHELEVMEVKAAFHAALQRTKHYSIAEFSTWPLLYQFEAFRSGYGGHRVLVKPDGFIRIYEDEAEANTKSFTHYCFLEVDRSTEKQDILINRAGCYFEHYKTGGFAVSNGATIDRFREFPFRVLIVFKSAERRNNTAERLLQNTPPILSLVWLTTLTEVIADPLGMIWIQPRDYREAVQGTMFDTEKWPRTLEYKRQAAREQWVEQKVRKQKLLSENVGN